MVLVGEAVLAGNVPDITASVRQRSLCTKVKHAAASCCRLQAANDVMGAMRSAMGGQHAARRTAGCGQCCQLRRQASPRPN
jgi:hypothetical protein